MKRTFAIVLTCEHRPSKLPEPIQVANALEFSTAREALSEALQCSVALNLAVPVVCDDAPPPAEGDAVPAPLADPDEFRHGGLKATEREDGIHVGSNKRGRLATMVLSPHTGQREALAYARLFAASPKLLEVLSQIEAAGRRKPGGAEAALQWIAEQARAAIAGARR